MSEPAAPVIGLVFGAVTPPQTDVVELLVHLGCSKEVGSYDVKLYNWNGKYSPGGAYPITVGLDGSISLGRSPNMPLLMTVRVENVKYQLSPTENFVIVSGRCWGEKLFRRTVTAIYTGMKGEEIAKDLMDSYAGLSHTRSTVELIEDTDTTYSELEYEDSPVWDILKYIAEASDDSGVIGFDFRVAPDGKFEFFLKNSKTNSTVIVEKIDDTAEYEKDIARIRNKITVYGLADKSVPVDKVAYTRSLTPSGGTWTASSGAVSLDNTGAPDGGACVKLAATTNYYGSANFTLNGGYLLNCEAYPIFAVMLKVEDDYGGTGQLTLYDNSYKVASKSISITPDLTWRSFEAGCGSAYASQWDSVEDGFDWTQILVARITFYFAAGVGTGDFFIHQLYVGGRRYSAVAQDATSQAAYGLREMSEYDEELWSDGECTRRAAALLDYLKDPAEHIYLVSTLVDYGTDPILAGDKVHVHLPNENVDSDFRVESAEYHVSRENPTELEITLELGRVNPQLADFLYGLRCHSPNVEKLSRTKLGKRGVPISSGGGGGGSSSSIFYSNIEIDKTAPVLNLLTGRVLKAVFGHDSVNAFLGSYAGDLVLYSASHIIRCNSDASDDLGSSTFRFGSLYLKNNLFVAGWEVIDNTGKLNLSSMTRGTAGYVLEAEGAGYDPLYVDPNGRYTPATHTHESVTRSGYKVEVDPSYAVLNFFDNVPALVGAVGHDGGNFFVVAYDGSLVLYAATGKILPNSDAGQDLGDTSLSLRFGTLHLKNGIYVAGVQTVDTNGRVTLAGFARDTAGYVLEAQGTGFYPMYVNPNGRYTPPAHSHASLYPSGGSDTGQVGDTDTYWHVIAGDSIWYNALGQMDMIDDIEAIKRMKRSKMVDSKGVPLIDVSTLPEQVKAENGMLHAGHLMGWAFGAIKQLNAKVEELQAELKTIRQNLNVKLTDKVTETPNAA